MKIYQKVIKNIFIFLSITHIGICVSAVPNKYIANYEIKEYKEELSQIFVEIEANNKIGVQTPINTFLKLNQNFTNIFPKFPQDYNFKVVYQQCLQLTDNLSNVYSYDTFMSFINNCYKPLSQILNKINSEFTTKASAISKPNHGPAPLNVTLDARASSDPSNETIPSENYFRYYRDINGIDQTIGIGPVINYTFKEAGNHLVHLTVKSSNKTNKGIFDGEKTLSIDVSPKSAIISIYANSKKLKIFEKTKFGTQEGKKGIVFDGSATIPIGGRQILSHTREIISNDGFKFTKQGIGNPGIIKVILPKEGEYKVKLKTQDNESNLISEEYFILISDPVSVIKQTPQQGNTNNIFSFDSSPSYSVISSLRLFTREIFDQQGNKQETFQGKSIKQQFKKPGAYTVKLTVEDELGQSNIDTTQVYIESSNPIAQFSKKPSQSRKYPSKFIFDANLSSDIDAENGFDKLTYDRNFSNPNYTTIENTTENNKKIEVSFDIISEHKIKLKVKDSFGKIHTIEKSINIKSTLRPEIFIAPKATTRGNNINFIVKANQNILNYVWDFGDGKTIRTQTNKVTHIYESIGSYKVTLKVNGTNGMENTITDIVFIGDKKSPIAAYNIINYQQKIIRQNEECTEIIDNNEIIHPSYKIEKYQIFTINPDDSVNIRGEKKDLDFYFQPQNGEIVKNNKFKYSFDKLGCQFIILTAKDTNMGINDTQKIRFKVYNALPKLKNLILHFPQYGNEMGIGFNENHVRDIFNTEFDPLIVKVQATDAHDPDGQISYFKRYYYYKDDPSRLIETKITPGDIDYTYFSLPKIPGEFMFGVTIYDNSEGKQSSEDIIGNGPVVFFPPDTKRPDIPLVTLKVDKTSVEVGDEIIFDVESKIISDRNDFITQRTILYDFDGDGKRDLTTKKDHISHSYTQANDIGYVPKVAVLYRGYSGIGKGGNIIVKKGLKPRILFDHIGSFTIFRDISIGEIKKKSTCLSIIDCKKGHEGYLIDSLINPYYSFTYPDNQKYFISLDIEDKYANKATKRIAIDLSTGNIKDNTGVIQLLSIPNAQYNNDDSIDIMVGKNLDNSILFYVLYQDTEQNKECYIDLDISDDNKKDFNCNELFFTKFTPKYKNTIGKIYYQVGSKIISKKLNISFLDFSIDLDKDTSILYNKISKLISSIKDKSLLVLLINLQKGIINPTEVQSNIVAIQNYITSSSNLILTDQEKIDIEEIINQLSDKTVISANGGTEYEIAKLEILGILPNNLKLDIERSFIDFENSIGDKDTGLSQNDKRKETLNKIISDISHKISINPEKQKSDEITKDDLDLIIMPNMCKIMEYYDIPSDKCSTQETKIIKDNSIQTETGNRSGLRILFIVLGSLLGIFIILIVIFAIKAKMKKGDDE